MMLELHKNYIVDKNQNLIAVQIPIDEFEKIEEILEDYFLDKIRKDQENAKILSQSKELLLKEKKAVPRNTIIPSSRLFNVSR